MASDISPQMIRSFGFDGAWSPEAQAAMVRQQQELQAGQTMRGNADQFLANRQNYYQQLMTGQLNAAQPQLDRQFQDATKQQQFRTMRRGMRGGSQDLEDQNRIAGERQQGMARMFQAGRGQALQARGQDQQTAHGWRQGSYRLRPGQQVRGANTMASLQTQGQIDAGNFGMLGDWQAGERYIAGVKGGNTGHGITQIGQGLGDFANMFGGGAAPGGK